MQPPENALKPVGHAFVDSSGDERFANGLAYWGRRVGAFAAGRHKECLGQQGEQHQRRYQNHDDERLFLLCQIERQPARFDSPASAGSPDEHNEEHDG